MKTSNTNKNSTTLYPLIKNLKTQVSQKKKQTTYCFNTQLTTKLAVKKQTIPKLNTNDYYKINLFTSIDKTPQYTKIIKKNISSNVKFIANKFKLKNLTVSKAKSKIIKPIVPKPITMNKNINILSNLTKTYSKLTNINKT
jgi:hypothetical protein